MLLYIYNVAAIAMVNKNWLPTCACHIEILYFTIQKMAHQGRDCNETYLWHFQPQQ